MQGSSLKGRNIPWQRKQGARRKVRTGVVVSNKMDKTIVVAVEYRTKHKLYDKIVKRTIKLKAHDKGNECQIGDRVRVMEPGSTLDVGV